MIPINERVKKHREVKKKLGYKTITFQVSEYDFRYLSDLKKLNNFTYEEILHELLLNLKQNSHKR